jgi:hypothetical protein
MLFEKLYEQRPMSWSECGRMPVSSFSTDFWLNMPVVGRPLRPRQRVQTSEIGPMTARKKHVRRLAKDHGRNGSRCDCRLAPR